MNHIFIFQEHFLEHLPLAFGARDWRTLFSGRNILDLGCDPQLRLGRYLVEEGAGSVYGLNALAHNKPGEVDRNLFFVHGDAASIPLPKESFDWVLGIAVLEHFSDVPGVMCEVARILKPGGKYCLHGGPFWNSPKGHHLYVKIEDTLYRFNDEQCPLPDFSHLSMQAHELRAFLSGKVQERHVERIVENVYQASFINRKPLEDIEQEILMAEGFEQKGSLRRKSNGPSRDLAERIYERCPVLVGKELGWGEMMVWGKKVL